jgi:hypothetical protein
METKVEKAVTASPQPEKRTYNFYGHGKFRYAIYPDFWADTWGDKPMLGVVYADCEFYAEREAYTRGILPLNWSIRPVAVCVGVAKPREPKEKRGGSSKAAA